MTRTETGMIRDAILAHGEWPNVSRYPGLWTTASFHTVYRAGRGQTSGTRIIRLLYISIPPKYKVGARLGAVIRVSSLQH